MPSPRMPPVPPRTSCPSPCVLCATLQRPLHYLACITLSSALLSPHLPASPCSAPPRRRSDQPTGRLALVFELMDMNIYEQIRGRRHYLPEARIKNCMYQLVRSLDHMHRNGVFHRDIKPENFLVLDVVLKVADFGSCRGIYSKQPYTEYISTRWYVGEKTWEKRH